MEFVYANDYQEVYPDMPLLHICNKLTQDGVSYKRIRIFVSCRVCGDEISVTPSVYRRQKHLPANGIVQVEREVLIVPFQNLALSEYKHLIKNKLL